MNKRKFLTIHFFRLTTVLLFVGLMFVASCAKREIVASPGKTPEKTPEKVKRVIENNDLKKNFDEYKVTGCFVLYDKNENKFVRYNAKRCAQGFMPASTFKIPNTLIALETGVVKDETTSIKWDGVKRMRAEWNRDQTLESAFKYSAFWFYQEIARRVGEEKMKKYVNDFEYGNRDISGKIDEFWLHGNMRISPEEQIVFLRKLNENKLPVSERSINILKKIMLAETGVDYKLFAKTGAGRDGDKVIGWYVGFIERNGNVYYFANNIETDDANRSFLPARIEIAVKNLKELGLLEGKKK